MEWPDNGDERTSPANAKGNGFKGDNIYIVFMKTIIIILSSRDGGGLKRKDIFNSNNIITFSHRR